MTRAYTPSSDRVSDWLAHAREYLAGCDRDSMPGDEEACDLAEALIVAAPALAEALRNPAGLDDHSLARMSEGDLRKLIVEYRTEARAALALIDGEG